MSIGLAPSAARALLAPATKGAAEVNRHINWTRQIKLKPASRKQILFVLADNANAQNEVWLSVPTIRDETGRCRRVICNALDDLENENVEFQNPNPQGSHNEPTKRIECGSHALPQNIASILATSDTRLVFDGSDRLGSLEKLLGPKEWNKCGAMWRMRARSGEASAKALRNATENFFILTPDERSKIKNRAGWVTDRYMRGFDKLNASPRLSNR